VAWSIGPVAHAQDTELEQLNEKIILLYGRGQYADAISLAEKALGIVENSKDPNELDVASIKNNLAELKVATGQYAEAEALFQQSLSIRRNAIGSEHPDVAIALKNLAALYYKQAKYSEATSMLEESLRIQEKTLGLQHPEVATGLNNLAELYRTVGRYTEAERCYKRALAILEGTLGANHPTVAAIKNNLAGLKAATGQYTEAEALLQQALSIRKNVLGLQHPDVARTLYSLAALYYKQTRYAEAESLLRESLSIRLKTLGLDHPDLAMTMNSLAEIYDREAKYADAEALLRRSVSIQENALGLKHPDVATSLERLARLLEETGRAEESDTLRRRAASIRAVSVDPNSLWRIVHDQCVPHAQVQANPRPCETVNLQNGEMKGFVILKDLRGAAQFLLIPTAVITGIDDPALLSPESPNYWDDAWRARTFVEERVQKSLGRDDFGMAVNSVAGRTQNQLSIHLACIRPEVVETLRNRESAIIDDWIPLPVPLSGHNYFIRRVATEELGNVNPFRLLADGLPTAREQMGRYALVVVGATFRDGKKGFYLLSHSSDPHAKDLGGGEELLDLDCVLR
jgi:CDP-diacylglycerol diphosphatase